MATVTAPKTETVAVLLDRIEQQRVLIARSRAERAEARAADKRRLVELEEAQRNVYAAAARSGTLFDVAEVRREQAEIAAREDEFKLAGAGAKRAELELRNERLAIIREHRAELLNNAAKARGDGEAALISLRAAVAKLGDIRLRIAATSSLALEGADDATRESLAVWPWVLPPRVQLDKSRSPWALLDAAIAALSQTPLRSRQEVSDQVRHADDAPIIKSIPTTTDAVIAARRERATAEAAS
jgi:hypothetical protein